MCNIHTISEMPRISCQLVWLKFGDLFVAYQKSGSFMHLYGEKIL